MEQANFDFVKFVDPDGVDGTLQSMILNESSARLPYGIFVAQAAMRLKADKDKLVQQNIRLSKALQEAGLEL